MNVFGVLLFIAMMSGCHRPQLSQAPHEGSAAWWPLDLRSAWLDAPTRGALLSGDYSYVLKHARVYPEPYRSILHAEIYQRLGAWDQQASVLESLSKRGMISMQEAWIVLSRNPVEPVAPSHPWARIAWVGQKYAGPAWRRNMDALCAEGLHEACTPPLRLPRRIALLVPTEGAFANSAASFKEGFIAAVMAQDPSITVHLMNSEQETAQLQAALKAYNPDWVVGPMGRAAIKRYVSWEPPYQTLLLGECEAQQSDRRYCFSLSTSQEIPHLDQRAYAMGLSILVLDEDTGQERAWDQGFTRVPEQRYLLSDSAWQHAPGVQVWALNLRASLIKKALQQMAEQGMPPHIMFAPSLWAKAFYGVGVDYFDARMMLDERYMPPVWQEVAPFVLHVPSGVHKRFLLWGMDAFMMLIGYGQVMPYAGGTGMCYWHEHRVVRGLDLASSRRGRV